MKNRKNAHTAFQRVVFAGALIFCTAFSLPAQSKKAIAVIPVQGSELAASDNWAFIQKFDDYLQLRNRFHHNKTENVKLYFDAVNIPLESDAAELKNIASDMRLDLLLLTKVIVNNGNRQLKASLFNVATGAVTKTAIELCQCQPGEWSTFPFAKIDEILFDAPEIILSTEAEKPAILPPPTIIRLPEAPVIADTTAQQSDLQPGQSEPASQPRVRKKGRSWKHYMIGAALVGGGVIYFATQGGNGSDETEPLSKLDDPPGPPSTGSN